MKNFKYALENIVRRPVIFFITIVQIIIAVMVITTGLIWSVKSIEVSYRTKNMFNNQEVYSLVDDSNMNFIIDTTSKSDGIDRLDELYNFMKDNFSICSYNTTNMLIKDFTDNNKFYSNIENDKKYQINPYEGIEGKFSDVKSIYVDESFVREFPFEIADGRCFESQEYDEDDSSITPIILGSGYKGIYKVGDTFDYFDYRNKKISKLKVVGRLDNNSYFFAGGSVESFDNYIIWPYKNISKETATAITYREWFARCIIKTNNSDETLKEIRNKNSELNLFNFRLSSCKNSTDKVVQSLNNEAKKTIEISIAILLFVSIGLVCVQINFINEHITEFGIHLLSGASKKDITNRIVMAISIQLLVGMVIGAYLGYRTNKEIYNFGIIWILIPMFVILDIIISAIPIWIIRKLQINDIIKRDE